MISPSRISFAVAVACAGLPVSMLLAQQAAPTPATTPSVSVPAAAPAAESGATAEEGHRGKMRERLATLTPDERQRLKAANEKARQDPAVKAAEATRESDPKAFRQTMHAALLRADPSIEPILLKLREAGPTKKKDF